MSVEDIHRIDASLRFLLGGHVAALSEDELEALARLRETIGKVTEEAGREVGSAYRRMTGDQQR